MYKDSIAKIIQTYIKPIKLILIATNPILRQKYDKMHLQNFI